MELFDLRGVRLGVVRFSLSLFVFPPRCLFRVFFCLCWSFVFLPVLLPCVVPSAFFFFVFVSFSFLVFGVWLFLLLALVFLSSLSFCFLLLLALFESPLLSSRPPF
ncbi:unnamed protein product [Polarella glacialis]|uniref:Uncharacterized protein n=1 Tax=Polarella glacialis TaxID=89957 RepID=A0A813M0M1_POLGL|nr:unnamed protein product [Polarella glacialis]